MWSSKVPVCFLKKAKRVLQFFLILQNPPPPKVTKSTFYNIFSSLLILSTSNFFGKTKVYLLWKIKFFFDGEWKNIWIWKVKTPKPWYLAILGDFQFFKFNFFCHFWFPIKKYFFFRANILCLTKNIFGLIASTEKKIYYKR